MSSDLELSAIQMDRYRVGIENGTAHQTKKGNAVTTKMPNPRTAPMGKQQLRSRVACKSLSLLMAELILFNALAFPMNANAQSAGPSQDGGEGGMCNASPQEQAQEEDGLDDANPGGDEGDDDSGPDDNGDPYADDAIDIDTSSPGPSDMPESGDFGDGGGASGSVSGNDGPGGDESAGGGGGWGGGTGGGRPDDDQASVAADPINLRLADKGHVQVDYASAGAAPLRWSRVYHSNLSAFAAATTQPMGTGWRGYYDRSIQTIAAGQVRLHRANGVAVDFVWNGSSWVSSTPAGTLSYLGSSWTYVNTRNIVETYDGNGRLLSLNERGRVTNLNYDAAGKLSSVNNGFGRSLGFAYDAAGRLNKLVLPGGGSLSYAYDSRNNLASAMFADGTVRQYAYENASYPNALTGITDESGRRRLSFGYDTAGRPNMGKFGSAVARVDITYSGNNVTTQDARGTQRVRSYAQVGNRRLLTSLQTSNTADSPATSWSFSYDGNGQMISLQSRTGEQRSRTVDGAGRPLSLTRAAGTAQAISVSHVWHPTFRIATQTTAGGLVKRREVDNLGRVTRVSQVGTDGATRTLLQRSFNAQGLLSSVTDARGVTTSFAYDAAANLTSRSNSLGQTFSYSQHDSHGRPTRITRPDGVVITRTFDTRGRLASRMVGGLTTRYSYDESGRLTQKQGPDGSWQSRSYDAAGLLQSKSNHRGESITFARDVDGSVLRTSSLASGGALAYSAARQLDSRGRLQAWVDSRGFRTVHGYGADGRLASVTDPLGRVSSFAFDLTDRPTVLTVPNTSAARAAGGPATVTATNTYVPSTGALSGQRDTRAVSTSYTFDSFQRRLADISPDAGTRVATKSAAGDVISRNDSRGVTVTITRDGFGRPTQLKSGTSTLASFTYVPGRSDLLPASMSDTSGSTAWTYDSLGRLLTKSQTIAGVSRVLTLTRDTVGRVVQAQYPSGLLVSYTYDADRVASIAVGSQTIMSSIQYLPNTQTPVSWRWSTGQTYSRSFDVDGRISAVTLGPTSRSYVYDAAGRIASQTDSAGASPGTTSITYDELGQLTAYTSSQGNFTYAYDSNGNRLSYTTGGTTYTNTFAAGTNRILTSPNGTFSYDAVGNMISDGYYSITYDPLGRMVGFNASNEYKVTRKFNAQGMRVAITASQYQQGGGIPHGMGDANKPAGGGTTAGKPVLAPLHAELVKRAAANPNAGTGGQWVLVSDRQMFYADDGKLLGEYVARGTSVTQETVWFAGQPVAAVINGVLHLISADNLGTPRSMQRASDGVEVWRWGGEPFGNSVPALANVTYNLRFPGQEYETETGYYYNWMRDYNPWAGRYLQPDPIGLAGGMARYAYVGGNPLSYTDPRGLDNPGMGPYWVPLNVGAMTTYVTNNAQSRSQGQCAAYVRRGMEAGGADLRKRPVAAADYGNTLVREGFRGLDPSGYVPQAGDVAVYGRVPGSDYGHIQMYNGTQWVSDFLQRSVVPGPGYAGSSPSFFRP